MRALWRFVWGLVLCGSLSAAGWAASLPDFTRLVAEQGRAVVNISASGEEPAASGFPELDEDDPMFDFFRRFVPRHPRLPSEPSENRSLGSGFILSADGYILTNAHVVEGGDEIVVRLVDKREFRARVVGSDKRTDIALLHIEATDLPTLRIGNPDALAVGEWVVAIGAPFGFENSVTAGIVSAKGRSLPQENFVPFIQTDVAINPGNSGGPLFNLRGEVVGINSQIYSRTGGFMGLSFAIPIDVAMDIQAQLREHGRIERGRIGVVIQELSRELAESFALADARGALVSSVEPGSPADKAGVRQGDVILRFDGTVVESSTDLPRIVGRTRPDSRVEMEVFRNGQHQRLALMVGALREEAPARTRAPLAKPADVPANRLGLVLRELSPAEQRAFGRDAGVMIEVARGVAGRAQLQSGDLVQAVVLAGRQLQVRGVAHFNELVAQMQPGQALTLLVRRADQVSFVSLRLEP